MNYEPPVITAYKNISQTACQFDWLDYEREYWNSGQLLGYMIYYEKVTDDLHYNQSLYTNFKDFDNVTLSGVIDELEVFTNYSFYVTTVNDIGIGYNGAHLFCRTDQGGE